MTSVLDGDKANTGLPLSELAKTFGDGRLDGKLPTFMPLTALSSFVRERGIYPRDGRIHAVQGSEVATLLREQTLQQVESRINSMVDELRDAEGKRKEVLNRATRLAETSLDSYELHYFANMFMPYKAVLRAIAKNPNLSEKTQYQLASTQDLQNDRELQLSLAHNPALCPEVMEKIMGYTQDVFVLQGIAHNAARKSQIDKSDMRYADICKQLATVHWDETLSKAAIPGVKDAELLRTMAGNNSALIAPDKLALIAQNKHTPDDVLEAMAKQPAARAQRLFGIDYAIKARSTLALKQQERMAMMSAEMAP